MIGHAPYVSHDGPGALAAERVRDAWRTHVGKALNGSQYQDLWLLRAANYGIRCLAVWLNFGRRADAQAQRLRVLGRDVMRVTPNSSFAYGDTT